MVEKKAARPRAVRNPSETAREALLRAAIRLLNEEGGGTVSLHRIAAAAGVNVALVKYYFGDKDSLFRAVTEQIIEEWRAHLQRAVPTEGSATEKLTARLGATAEMFHRYPSLTQLIIQTILQPDGTQTALFLDRFLRPNLAEQTALLKAGEEAGEFRPVDPILFFMTYIGLTNAFSTTMPLLRALLGEGQTDEATLARFVRHAADLMLHGIAARPPD